MKILAIISMTIKRRLAYFSAMWFGMITTIISIVVYYFLWAAIFLNRQSFSGYSFSMIVTYVVLSRIISSQFSGGINETLAQWVYEGTIAVELLRPIGLVRSLFAQRLGELFHFVSLRALPLAIVASLVLGVSPPAGFMAGLLFAAGFLVSFILLFCIELIVGLLSFYTMNFYGVKFAKDALLTILSGGLVPLAFFPAAVRKIIELLPFQHLVSTPVNAYIGILSPAQALYSLGLELLWILVLSGVAVLFFRASIKKIVVQGG